MERKERVVGRQSVVSKKEYKKWAIVGAVVTLIGVGAYIVLSGISDKNPTAETIYQEMVEYQALGNQIRRYDVYTDNEEARNEIGEHGVFASMVSFNNKELSEHARTYGYDLYYKGVTIEVFNNEQDAVNREIQLQQMYNLFLEHYPVDTYEEPHILLKKYYNPVKVIREKNAILHIAKWCPEDFARSCEIRFSAVLKDKTFKQTAMPFPFEQEEWLKENMRHNWIRCLDEKDEIHAMLDEKAEAITTKIEALQERYNYPDYAELKVELKNCNIGYYEDTYDTWLRDMEAIEAKRAEERKNE